MRYAVAVLLTLLCAACPVASPPPKAPGGNASGMVVGAEFDGTPLTVGKGTLAEKPLVITWFATW
jgi:hypothetical protein